MSARDSIIWEQHVYLTVEVFIFGVILCFNVISGKFQNYAEYLKILYTLIGLFFLLIQLKRVKDIEMVCAVAFTIVADFFLVFSEEYFYGVIAFIIVQIFFAKRIADYMNISLFDMTNKAMILTLSVFFIILFNINTTSLFYFLIIIYIVLFGLNIINMLKCYMYVADINSKRFLLGLILFLLCDINVAFYNINMVLSSVNWPILKYCGQILWLFYLPSQVLLVLSSIYKDG